MKLTTVQKDRAAGVLLGQAIGDALGVPYEFGSTKLDGQAEMLGGGLGNYKPGEWSDDTQMAVCIAQVTAEGGDPLSDHVLDAVASRFLGWWFSGPADIGNQTRAVLSEASRHKGPIGAIMTEISEVRARAGSAGNGALMRTGIVGLVALDDSQTTALAAERFAKLTHADRRCVESCIIWSEAVRVAVVDGRLDVRAGLQLLPEDRRREWVELLTDAETQGPKAFVKNGFTVTALQAAWAAIHSTSHIKGPDHVRAALQAAIEIGHDTDTVAAIAGALLGARYGVSGLPSDLARRVQGWPYWTRARHLVNYALATATRERQPWPGPGTMITTPRGLSSPATQSPGVVETTATAGRVASSASVSRPNPGVVATRGLSSPATQSPGVVETIPHPDDPMVLMGTEHALAQAKDLGVTAVVSLSRVNDDDIRTAGVEDGKHAEIWLVDSNHPEDNAHLTWTLVDAARTVKALRDQGEKVLLHCVAAEHRTPSVAAAYSRLLGAEAVVAKRRIEAAFGREIDGYVWRTALAQDEEDLE